ncbi:1-aminocyclopropane-1-carboxylate synthase-like protein 1 [Trichomycterus rosablanca]|uniref:1-aminocyclopropane-1-carboxylate synthase-like protein 1 n=1 Tax=Trichomycterus rosablanca TaxID=2290929 RepID=UPI002F35C3E3
MDFPSRKYERGSNWSEPEVVQLLQLWSDEAVQTELESCIRNQHVFNRIAEALHDRGIYRSADQCRDKIKKLKLDYRRMKENYQTPRGGRARKFYDVLDRVLSSRPAASSSSSSSSYCALWGNANVHQTFPSSSTSSFTFSCPPKPGELMEIKLEELNADGEEELLSADEPLCSEEEEEEEEEQDCKTAGEDKEEIGEAAVRGESAAPYAGWSPSGFSDNMAGSSGAAVSPAAVPVQNTEKANQDDLGGPKHSSTIPQRKRRQPVQVGSCGRMLEKALTSFISWQRVMEERYMSLEEMRLQQEARAEEHRIQQEERRAQQEREHELRIISLLTGAFSAAKGNSNYMNLDTNTASEQTSIFGPSVHPPGHLTSLSTTKTLQRDQGGTNTPGVSELMSDSFIHQSHPAPSKLSTVPQSVKTGQRPDNGDARTNISNLNPAMSESASFSIPLTPSCSAQFSPKASTLPSGSSLLTGNQTLKPSKFLSQRGNRICQHQGILQEGYSQYHANKYDENSNPDGIINMGTSENKLCLDLLQQRLVQPDMLYVEPSLLQYPDWKGHFFLRKEVAEFLSEHCNSPKPLKAENVVVMNGCGSLFSALAAVLCDPDDAILIPTPFYGAIMEDVDLYGSVKLYYVPLDSEPSQNDDKPFHLTVEKLELSLQSAKKEGVNVRALILVNPQNPLGEIYTAEEMTCFLEFAKKHELHAVVDEIYMLSVFDGLFTSVLSLQRLPDPQRTHIMWGISKDFAMAGMRLGTLYSENNDLVQALDKLGCFHGVTGTTQHQVAQLLKDKDWVNNTFLPENRRRLQEAHQYVSTQLKRLGIPYLHKGAGFFIWADFSKYLKQQTCEEELCIWKCFLKHRVLLSCGQAFSCSSPGWFRIIFSDQHRRLQIGLERIKKTLEEIQACNMMSDNEKTKAETQKHYTKTWDNSDTDSSKDSTMAALLTPKGHSQANGTVGANLLLADEDLPIVDNGQSTSNSEILDSLIGVLRQQIHSSDWLEKNRPKLAAGEDPTQADVFKDLLDRARI